MPLKYSWQKVALLRWSLFIIAEIFARTWISHISHASSAPNQSHVADLALTCIHLIVVSVCTEDLQIANKKAGLPSTFHGLNIRQGVAVSGTSSCGKTKLTVRKQEAAREEKLKGLTVSHGLTLTSVCSFPVGNVLQEKQQRGSFEEHCFEGCQPVPRCVGNGWRRWCTRAGGDCCLLERLAGC